MPRTLRITRLGRAYLFLTIGIGIGALNTGNNLLYLVLGFMLGIIIVSGVLSELIVWDLDVRRFVPEGVFANEPFHMRYELTRSRGRGFAIQLRELVPTLTGSAWAPVLRGKEPEVVRAAMTASQRGPIRLEQIEISTQFPFGIFEKIRVIRRPGMVLVYPKRGFSCAPPDANGGRNVGESGNPRLRDGTGDILGLRELHDGEDARRVHWKKSASIGKLLRVERDRDDRQQYTISMDTAQTGDPLERSCEETAAVCRLLLDQGHDVGLSAGLHVIRPSNGVGHERRILTALAWVGYEAERGR